MLLQITNSILIDINNINNLNIINNNSMISTADITSLYPSIHINYGIALIKLFFKNFKLEIEKIFPYFYEKEIIYNNQLIPNIYYYNLIIDLLIYVLNNNYFNIIIKYIINIKVQQWVHH